ncbi:MAG: cytochrome C [Ginsengibacter sp.]
MKKIVLTILVIIVIVIGVAASYVKFGLPRVAPATDLHVDATPERIAHGKYLANHVTICMDCHSTRDWSRFSGPPEPGTLGKGGETFDKKMGFPGNFYARNITPAHLKNWTDGEIFRAITTGVNAKGEALFPLMPYESYGKMDKEDIYDIIAYVRSLPSIEHNVPDHTVDFPMNFIINTIPGEAHLVQKPPKSDTLKYGAYLLNASGCIECHTKADKGQIIMDLAFSGGRDFKFPQGVTYSANITPDKKTGLGNWTAEDFVARFKAYNDSTNYPTLKVGQLNTIMPWVMYAGIDTADLRSMYAYLKTIKPISNKVDHFVLAEK